jgi:hypothetical protein
MLEENRRFWAIGGAVLVVVVIVLGGYLVFRGGAESKVTVRSIPNDLTLTLDGRAIAANGEVKVKEGTHTLVAVRRGFESHTETIKVAGGDPLSVKMYLFSNSPEGRTWEKDHPDQELETEAEAGRRYQEMDDRITRKYSIMQELPYIGPGFKVDYGVSKAHPDDPEQLAFYIKLTDSEGKKKALEWLNGHGYNPAELELIFTTK